MIRLEEIRINPNAPDFAKPHPKQESIWHHQYPDGYERANMKAYPAVDSEITAWQEGMEETRALARGLGMAPRDDRMSQVTIPTVMMVVKVLTGSTVHFIIHQISLVT